MKAFISWSGERSSSLGQALRDWLPMVLQYVEPWLSQSDINAGERWASEVGKELESSNFGIICITRENASSPWILFESGALAKFMQEGRVVPLLLDIEFKDITGPLAQFQAKKVEKTGLLDIVTSINKFSDGKLTEANLNRQFEALWSHFEVKISEIPKSIPQNRQNRNQHEILEELVSGVRGLEMRFRENQEENPRTRFKKNRPHPSMVRDFLFSSEFGPNDPIIFLILPSLIKDEVPWLYELGVEAYREATSQGRKTKAIARFISTIKSLRRSSFLDLVDRDSHMMFRELEHLFLDVYSGEFTNTIVNFKE